jgi:hypothetical protein
MDAKLKYAVDMVLDAFDDAAINAPGATREERIVALVDEILPQLIERRSQADPTDENQDLTSGEKAAFMHLLRKSIEETKDCVAAALVRITHGGQVMVAGASTGLKNEFIPELGRRLKAATYGFAFAATNVDACGCPACVARRTSFNRGDIVHMPFTGPKAEA